MVKDWPLVPIGSFRKVERGTRLVRSQLSLKGKYPVYQNSLEPLGYYDEANCPANSLYIIAAGSAAEMGFSAVPFWAADDCYFFRKSQNFDQRYLYYALMKRQDYLKLHSRRTSIPRLSRDVIDKLEIFLPIIEEQKAIAGTIATFDTHITNLDKLIEKKKAIRDGALEDLVSGRTRLPGFDYKWEYSQIGRILKILHGKNQHEVESPSGHYPIMGTGGVIGKATEYLCDWECVLIGRKGTIDQPYYMNTPFWTIDTLYYSRPAENQCVKFQYYLFCTINWYDYTESSGRPSLTRKAIEGIVIRLPRYEEQKAIADVLTAMDDEIKALEDERYKMIQIREAAMDDLLTGRVRLMM